MAHTNPDHASFDYIAKAVGDLRDRPIRRVYEFGQGWLVCLHCGIALSLVAPVDGKFKQFGHPVNVAGVFECPMGGKRFQMPTVVVEEVPQ